MKKVLNILPILVAIGLFDIIYLYGYVYWPIALMVNIMAGYFVIEKFSKMEKGKIKAILATDSKWGIGLNNDLPWDFRDYPEDMKNFKEVTTNNVIVMGRGCFESLNNNPLPNRINVVISTTLEDNIEGVKVLKSIPEAIKWWKQNHNQLDLIFTGGAGIYKEVMENNLVDELIHTSIARVHNCDVFCELDIEKYLKFKETKVYEPRSIKQSVYHITTWVRK